MGLVLNPTLTNSPRTVIVWAADKQFAGRGLISKENTPTNRPRSKELTIRGAVLGVELG